LKRHAHCLAAFQYFYGAIDWTPIGEKGKLHLGGSSRWALIFKRSNTGHRQAPPHVELHPAERIFFDEP
jgi:hypothetical protein